MNMAQTFAPARLAAQHCAELTCRSVRPEERGESIAAWSRDIGRALSQDLAALFAGSRVVASLGEPEWLVGKEVFDRIGPVAANSLLRCGEADRTLLLSMDYATAIALTDRSFGGEGGTPDAIPDTLPRSAALLVDQAARIVATAVAGASANAPQDGDVIIRSDSASRLKPFSAETRCALFTVRLAADGRPGWQAFLALSVERLEHLLPDLATPAPVAPRSAAAIDTVFGAIPLSLRAVLAEFSLSLDQLERLRPGDRIPIAVPREVPLQVGSRTLAHGTIGTHHDRIALQLTGAICERTIP